MPCLFSLYFRHVHIPPSTLLSLSQRLPLPLPFLRCSRTPIMHHFVTWTRRGRKSKRQQKPSLRSGTSPAEPKGEWDEKKDVEATDPPACCHFDLGSGDVSRLNSTPRSINEDASVCKADAITGRYLLPFALPRITDRPISLITQLYADLSLSDFSGHHLIHLSTRWVKTMTMRLRKLCSLLFVLF